MGGGGSTIIKVKGDSVPDGCLYNKLLSWFMPPQGAKYIAPQK